MRRSGPPPRFRQNVTRLRSRRDGRTPRKSSCSPACPSPAASWRQWARDAARIGAPLVMRGVAEGSLRATVKRIGGRLGGAEAGVAIDPRLFRLFGVTRVPRRGRRAGRRAGMPQPGLFGTIRRRPTTE